MGDSGALGNNRKPFFALENYEEQTVFSWLKQDLAALKSDSWRRLEKVRNNYLRYKGIQYAYQVYQPRDLPEQQKRYMPQMVVPILQDLVDEKVARLLEIRPGRVVMPRNDETEDKVDAKIAKRFLTHIDYTEKMDEIERAWVTNGEIAGESFLLTLWNPDKGSVHPLYKPGMKAEGLPNKPIRIGDVDYVIRSPRQFFHENVPSKKWRDVSYCYDIDYVYTEALKKDYPAKAEKISPNANPVKVFDLDTMEEKQLYGVTEKVTFYYRSDKYLEEGFQVTFCDQALLEMGPLKYKHGKLPVTRYIGKQNQEELHGESYFEPLRGMASQVTNMTNMMIKQIMLCAHPKWMIEAGSVDEQQLNNDAGIVRLKAGARPPVLAQANPVSPQTFEFRQNLKEEVYQFGKSNSIVQGDPPPGVTAFVAMQYLGENENKRMALDVAKLLTARLERDNLTLETCAQFYKKDDQRTMWVIGKDANWTAQQYDPSSLAKPFNIDIQTTTALPDSKAARTQFVLDMSRDPELSTLLPKEQKLEMLGLAQADKFIDVGSAAARAAEDEQEYIMDGSGQMEPKEWEDHITHWRVHTMYMQSVGFKTKSNPEDQQTLKDHVLATEMLMIQQAQKSQAFAQQLAMLPQFPMFFFTPPTPPSAMQPEIPPEGEVQS